MLGAQGLSIESNHSPCELCWPHYEEFSLCLARRHVTADCVGINRRKHAPRPKQAVAQLLSPPHEDQVDPARITFSPAFSQDLWSIESLSCFRESSQLHPRMVMLVLSFSADPPPAPQTKRTARARTPRRSFMLHQKPRYLSQPHRPE